MHFMGLYQVFFPLLVFIGWFPSNAQDLDYAHQVVRYLSSQELKGRGYVGNADKLAANYIAQEFKKLGIQPIDSSYLQHFEFSVNTLPGDLMLKINGNPLVAGKDYIVEPGCPSGSGVSETVQIPFYDLLDQLTWAEYVLEAQDRFLVIEELLASPLEWEEKETINNALNFLKYHPQGDWKGVLILTDQKLNWFGSTQQFNRPTFIVRRSSIVDSVKTIEWTIESVFKPQYKSQNVVGMIEGINKDSLVVITAHYDHLGMMGNRVYFPGANDNASGVAMMLNLAQHYSREKPPYSTIFMAFGGEELGLIGSRYFVDNPLFSLEQIKFLLNFDLAGTGDEGIQVVNGSVHLKEFELLLTINDEMALLPQVKIRGEACNSDHCYFHKKGVPCFFMYTLGGIQAYHDIYDRADTLPLTEFEDYFNLMVAFIGQL